MFMRLRHYNLVGSNLPYMLGTLEHVSMRPVEVAVLPSKYSSAGWVNVIRCILPCTSQVKLTLYNLCHSSSG